VKPLHWTISFVGVCVVSILLAVLRVDDLETTNHESEIPVYLTTKVRIDSGVTAGIASRSLTLGRGWWDFGAMSYATTAGRGTRASHPKVKPLCPLLCWAACRSLFSP
jgi:hypothetical protein